MVDFSGRPGKGMETHSRSKRATEGFLYSSEEEKRPVNSSGGAGGKAFQFSLSPNLPINFNRFNID